MFHLFQCAIFTMTIPTEAFTRNRLMDWQQDRLRTIYLTAFRISRIMLSCYSIYRLVRFWGNIPGQCFRPFSNNGYLVALAATYILFDISSGIETLSMEANYRHRIAAMGRDIRAQNARDKSKPIQRGSGLPWTFIEGISLLCGSVFGVLSVLENRKQIVGDENSFSFGQVTALVTLVASFYKIGDSLYSKPCVPS